MESLDRQIQALRDDLANCPAWKLTHEWGVYRADLLAHLVARRESFAEMN